MTTVAVRERPITAKDWEVRALLAGRKVQWRKICKDQDIGVATFPDRRLRGPVGSRVYELHGEWTDAERDYWVSTFCPWKVGECLFVRETFVLEHWTYEFYDKPPQITDRPVKHERDDSGERWLIPHYKATEPEPHIVSLYGQQEESDDRTRWSPAGHMPRWASRITLELTDVRVEKVQAITEADARSEGFERPVIGCALDNFYRNWNDTYGEGSWEVNPWVWVLVFKVASPTPSP